MRGVLPRGVAAEEGGGDVKPILFNTEMVRAILDGKKTVTRRVIKFPDGMTGRLPINGERDYLFYPCGIKYPPYHLGDILYVRETWAYSQDNGHVRIIYKADNPNCPVDRWFPSIHMEKRDARIFLRVTDMWVERLEDITEDEARNEGAQPVMASTDPPNTPENQRTWHEWLPALPHFIEIWDSTIKPADRDKYGWGANPWVWVIEFERISREETLNK